jgi:thioredoxin-related protein
MMVCGAAALAAAATPSTPEEAPPAAAMKVKSASLRHGVFRHTSYPAAWTAAQESGRPILVYVTSQSCPHCTRMLGETYQRASLRTFMTGSFETVFVDRAEQPELAQKLHVRLFPTTLIVGGDNKVIDVIEGYVDASAFSRRLQTSLAANAAEETKTR